MNRAMLMSLLALLVAVACAAQPQTETVLRHENFIAFNAEAGEQVRIAVQSIQRGPTYGEQLRVSIINPDSEQVLRQTVPLSASEVIEYQATVSGLHVARLQAGWNACKAQVLDRPWALVAWGQVPLNIVGSMAKLHFFVPEQVKQFAISLIADVTGEGALITIADPDGNVRHEEEGDFDREQRIAVDVPPGTDGRAWSLSITRPKAQGLVLDDVQLSLGMGLPPLLAERPEWLDGFVNTGEYQPDVIDQVVPIEGGGSMGKGQSRTLQWQMAALPEGKVYALRMTANDVDYRDEVIASLNGGEPFNVPMTGDAQTQSFTVLIDRADLRVGENTLVLTQNPEGGSSGVSVADVELLIGDRIKEFRGW